MLDSLKFVQGAVAKKDFNPILTHFHIQGGKIKGTNGGLTLCVPIALDLDVKPKAIPFVKAVKGCKSQTMKMHITPTGKLSVKSGVFKALVDCSTEEFPMSEPEGKYIELHEEILPPLVKLLSVTGEDASRPWSLGILFRGEYAYATNNVILASYKLEKPFPVEMNIPKNAINEIIRIGKEPEGMMVCSTSVTFMYGKNHWVKTQLLDLAWPPVEKLLDMPSEQEPFPEGFFEAIESVAPFVGEFESVYFRDSKISTVPQDGETGADCGVEDFKSVGVFNYKFLLKLQGLADTIDFSNYPKPCVFKGNRIHGVIVGKSS